MLLLELGEAQYKPFIIWPLTYFLIKSRFFLYTPLSEFAHILQDSVQMVPTPRSLPWFWHLWRQEHTASLLGPKPRLHWVKATHSRNSLDILCSPLGVGTRSYLPWETPPLCPAQGLAPAGAQLGVAERSESLLWLLSVAELSGNPSNTPLG